MAEMILLFLSVVTLLSFPTTEADYLFHMCPNTTVFTRNSTFQSNRNHLLSTLSSNSTRTTGFYNATAGRSPSDTVYGMLLCRGDVTTAGCKTCVTTATSDTVQRCPVEKEVMMWYVDCMIRYSNKSLGDSAADGEQWPALGEQAFTRTCLKLNMNT
ncbi:cysteine-rich receptor-like protein kinase 25 [Argentina anserina]|uniref:cysteine-rich receptor-like protein kinase 25 n=1 Tax=Argentina anserina TaxID=57926 RepID=UPI002176510A|nr:cysteine-rich receptor-like protein kinase 25 [Potentilla anserina]